MSTSSREGRSLGAEEIAGRPEAVALRVVIVDDEPDVRLLLRMTLQLELGAEIVGEASTGEEGIVVIEQTQPDVAIVDLMMPGTGGLTLITELHARGVPTRLVAFSADAAALARSQEAGADASILKTTETDELLRAVTAT